ncbi:GDP-mannose 4,6-dehydratase-like protein [Usnea florida]
MVALAEVPFPGITGQDGYYLSRFLLSKGYKVHGLIRPSSRGCIAHQSTDPRVVQQYGDMLDAASLLRVLSSVPFDEVYHLAAQSHVHASFELASYSTDVIALGTLRLLEAMVNLGIEKKVKFFNACSSEVFGRVAEIPQTETTPFRPLSPYALAKAYGFWITVNMREIHGMFAVNGISFNHESPRRGPSFVSRKITLGVAEIALGVAKLIELGNLDARRDWSHSRDIVRGMYLMLQAESPDDFVLSSGESHSVRDFVEEAFRIIGVNIGWRGSGVQEIGIDLDDSAVRIRVNPKLHRPLEVPHLQGSSARATEILRWQRETSFPEVIREMVLADLEVVKHVSANKCSLGG